MNDDLYYVMIKYVNNATFYKLQFIKNIRYIGVINKRKQLISIDKDLQIQKFYYNLFSTQFGQKYYNIFYICENNNYVLPYRIISKFKYDLPNNYDKYYYFVNVPKVNYTEVSTQNNMVDLLSLYQQDKDRKMFLLDGNGALDLEFFEDNCVYKNTNIIIINLLNISRYKKYIDYVIFPIKEYNRGTFQRFFKQHCDNIEKIINKNIYKYICINMKNNLYYFNYI